MTDVSSIQSTLAAANAYTKAKSLDLATSDAGNVASTFENFVAEAAQSAIKDVQAHDGTIQAGLNGNASVQEVVEATMELENTVKVSIALRNKLIDAYHEILKMPI